MGIAWSPIWEPRPGGQAAQQRAGCRCASPCKTPSRYSLRPAGHAGRLALSLAARATRQPRSY